MVHSIFPEREPGLGPPSPDAEESAGAHAAGPVEPTAQSREPIPPASSEAGFTPSETDRATKEAWSKKVDEISSEETAKHLPEKLRIARRGLGYLYDLLPHHRLVTKEEISALIDHTELEELLPGMRQKLAEAIVKGAWHRAEKAKFIEQGVDVLTLWIHVEAGKDATPATLERLRQARKEQPAQPPTTLPPATELPESNEPPIE